MKTLRDALITVLIAAATCLVYDLISHPARTERRAFIEGRHRITAGKCEEWHAPLKPGDAGWWEPCK